MIDLSARPFFLDEKETEWVEAAVSTLSVYEKTGQLFCVMGGDYSEEELVRMVREDAAGGILFRPAPASELNAKYKKLDEAALLPLIKAANLEEGGTGAISDGTFFGWPMSAAAADDDSVMEKLALVCAREGRRIGINLTFSPVCDLDLNYRNPITNVRTCGSDPERVKKLCRIYTETLQSEGVAACAKHFPGDGVDYRDQHLHPTYNSLSASEWHASYGKVYKSLIDAGILAVMVGHICQPALCLAEDPSLSFADCLPGSLSPELLQGVLRGKLQFNGLIATDATIMGGFTQSMARRDAVPAAIEAGCDMLVFSTDFAEDRRYLLEALEDGRLSESRLDDAVRRILALKAWGLRQKEASPLSGETALSWRDECADKSITLVKSTQKLFPVTPEKHPLIRLITLGNDRMPEGSMTGLAEKILQNAGFQTERFDIEKEELHGTADLSSKRLTLYLCNLEHASNQTALRIFWAEKHALNAPRHVMEEPSVFISFSNPYHLQDVPRIRTCINAYSCNESTVRAALNKLLGFSSFKGKSPVDPFCGLPDTYL